ncbi:MAG: hypothetical protein LH645_09015 [Actinomycetia bacterium]|nr:hypothetical protein [Actinomycetes bacterium]
MTWSSRTQAAAGRHVCPATATSDPAMPGKILRAGGHTHRKDAPAAPPRRGALAAVLIGGVLMLSGWAMAAVSTFSESVTYCPLVLGGDLVTGSGDEAFCTPIIDERTRLVLIVGAVGLVLVVAGVVRGRSRLFGSSPPAGHVSVVTRVSLVILGLITLLLSSPLWVAAVLVTDSMNREWQDLVRAMFPVSIALAAFTVAAIASLLGRRGHRLTLDHLYGGSQPRRSTPGAGPR